MKNTIQVQLEGLQEQIAKAPGNIHWRIGEALNSIREGLLGTLPAEDATLLGRLSQPIEITKDAPYTVASHEATLLCNQMLSTFAGIPDVSRTTATAVAQSQKVFLVHGHDNAAQEQVARFLDKLGLETIILHEQANEGRTIIEKFTEYADVAFAVVLLTADDVGNVAGSSLQDLVPRARQNVVFELGYFIGRLGRARVCALYESSVEILSDYGGVLYVALDPHGAWRLQLAKEIRAAGLPIDLNLAM